MRHRFAIALAPLALLACSSAGEPVGIDQSASTWCPIDYVYECHEVVGRRVCDCVYVPPPPPPPVCNYVVNNPPPSPGISLWIAAWAVQSWGQCNDIPGNGGTWKDLVPVGPLYANCFNGVPNEYLDPAGAPSCRSQFPGGNCCTYVWWPDTFVEPTSCPPANPTSARASPSRSRTRSQPRPRRTPWPCAKATRGPGTRSKTGRVTSQLRAAPCRAAAPATPARRRRSCTDVHRPATSQGTRTRNAAQSEAGDRSRRASTASRIARPSSGAGAAASRA